MWKQYDICHVKLFTVVTIFEPFFDFLVVLFFWTMFGKILTEFFRKYNAIFRKIFGEKIRRKFPKIFQPTTLPLMQR